MSRNILISGASVAGNTAAWWLGRYGFDVTVVERTPQFRDGGQNIDIRGIGREVLRRMGLERKALDRGTGEKGTVWIDDKGAVVARFVTEELGSDGPTAEMEILRGDLARLLYEPARERATFRFSDHIERIEDGAEKVSVAFASGQTAHYDAVIIAEGVGSSTRELVFPQQNDPRWMDLTIAYFTISRKADDDQMWRWYNATQGRSISLRPDTHGTTRAMLSLHQPPNGEHEWSDEQQKAYLRKRFADAGWQAQRVLSAMEETDDFYFDVLRQVRMSQWSKGRVVLTGDAAWCVTPLAGIGATLAVTGGYVLASELQRGGDVRRVFSAYEEAMRPMVKKGQGVPKLAPRMMNPHSQLGISVLHKVLNIASKPAIRSLAAKIFASEPDGPDLSRYDAFMARIETGDRGPVA
ncbi:FAD-dependent monooxygenase [Agrobacterium rosae]|uniref:FAD-dependent monooxygenase n=1 Tax=Agrobacterium rosae TaxID=1972867 RepID=UPI0020346896|nr:FAD-dependent monooxygenase [Agrobacterium rosae]MCM2435575.1 FAD-binding monooxygenase [Agrobacterium rosae]